MQAVPQTGVYQSAANPALRLAVVESAGDLPDGDLGTFESTYWLTVVPADAVNDMQSIPIGAQELERADWERLVGEHRLQHVAPLPD